MPTPAELRQLYPNLAGYSDGEIVDLWAQNYGIDRRSAAADLGVQINEPGFTTTLKRSVGQMLGGVGEIWGDLTDNPDNALSRYAEGVQFRNPSGIGSLQDVWDKPGLAAQEALAQGLTFLGPGLVGKGLQAAGAARGLSALSTVGRALNSFPAQAGLAALPSVDEIGELQREAGVDDPWAKYGGAAAVGAIETLGGAQRMLGIGRNATRTTADLAQEFGRTPLRTFGRQVVRSGLEEAGEELVQTPIERAAGYHEPFDQEGLDQMALGGVMGGLGGLMLGPAGGARYALAHRALANRTGLSGPHDPLDLLARAEQLDREEAFANDPYARQMRAEWDAELARRDAVAQAFRERHVFGEQQPLQEFIDQQLGIGAPPAVSRAEVKAAFDERIDPTVVVGEDGVARVVDRAGDWYAYRQAGMRPAAPFPSSAPVEMPELPGLSGAEYSGTLDYPQTRRPAPADGFSSNRQRAIWQQALASLGADHPELPTINQLITENKIPLALKRLTEAQNALQVAGTAPVDARPQVGDGAALGAGDAQAPAAAAPSQVQGAQEVARTPEQARQQLALIMTPVEKQAVYDILGWDEEGNQSRAPMSQAAAAKARGVSRQRMNQVLKALGLDKDKIARLQASGAGAEGVDITELLPTQAEDERVGEVGTGFRVMDRPNAADDIIDDARTARETRQAEEWLKQHALDDPVDNTDLASPEPPPSRAHVQNHNQVRYDAAGQAWEDTRDGDEQIPAWDSLSDDRQEAWMNYLQEAARNPKARNRYKAQESIVADGFYSEADEEESPLSRAITRWNQVVRDWVAGKIDRATSPVVFDFTPAVLQVLGLPNYEIRAKGRHFIEDSLFDHGVKPSQLGEVARDLTDPVAVFLVKDSQGNYSLNILTRQYASEGQLVVALQPMEGSREGPAHMAATVFSRTPKKLGDYAREGWMVYQGDTSAMPPELVQGIAEGKRKYGQTAVDLSAVFAGKFGGRAGGLNAVKAVRDGALARSKRILYRADARKLIESGQALFSEQGSSATAAKARIESILTKLFFSKERLAKLVTVYARQDEARAAGALSETFRGRAKGWVNNGRVHLVAENIPAGHELAVFLHEVGVHLGMKKLVGAQNMQWLAERVEAWAARNDASLEFRIARGAVERAKRSQSQGPDAYQQELIAYFVEGAVTAGVEPTAVKQGSNDFRTWFRTLWAAAKQALRKLGFKNPEQFTGQHLVDLAMGAARLEVSGMWHDTTRDYDKIAEVLKRLYGEDGYEDFLRAATVFRTDAQARLGPGTPHYQPGTIPLVEKLRLQSERVLADLRGKGFDAQRRHEGKLGRFTGYTTFAELKDDPLSGEQTFQMSVITDDQVARARRDAKLYGVSVNEMIQEQGATLTITVQGDGELSIYGPDARTTFYQELKREGLATEARGKDGKIQYLADGVPWTALTGARLTQLTPLLAEAHARLRLSSDRKHAGLYWRRTTGATGATDESGVLGRPASMYFSEVEPTPAQIEQTIAKLPAPLQGPAHRFATNLNDLVKKATYATAFGHDLADLVAKVLPSAKRYFDLMGEKGATRLHHEAIVDRIMERASRVRDKAALNRYLMDSTMGRKWGFKPAWDQTAVVDEGMKAQFDKLSSDAQAIAREVFEHGHRVLTQLRELVRREIEEAYAEEGESLAPAERKKLEAKKLRELRLFDERFAALAGPYAPLKRFGNYVMVAKSQAYLDAEKNGDEKWIEAHQGDPAHYRVEFHETLGAASWRARQLERQYAAVTAKEKQAYYREFEAPWQAMKRLQTMVKDEFGAGSKQARQINSMLKDLYLSTLSEASARQAYNRRENIAGADPDMLRAFASKGKADAAFIAALQHGAEVNQALSAMRGEAKDADSARALNEVLARHAASLEYRETPWQDKLAAVNSFWMLLTNPAYYLQNATQPFMMTLPWLAGRYGHARSTSALIQAYRDIARGKLEVEAMPLTDDEKRMLGQLKDQGILDIGINRELGYWESGGGRASQLVASVNFKLSTAVQQVEMLNRISSALAAYRLSGGKVEEAAKVLRVTHGDYSAFNAPRAFNLPGAKLLLQFRKFQLIQLSLLARLTHQAFKGASAEERAVARKSLAFLLGHHFVMAGALGLPAANLLGWAVAAALGEPGDPKDEEYLLRRAIGDEAYANLLLKGVPAALGLDLSRKLGMGQATTIVPFVDADPLTRKGYAEYLMGLAGPLLGGLAPRIADGLGLMRQGDIYKGLEQLLPTGLRQAMKGYREATEGVSLRNNDVVLGPEEVTFLQGFMVALGLPTTQLTERQRRQGDLIEFERHFTEKTSEIKHRYAKAYREGDGAQLAELREEWKVLQEAKVRNGFKRAPLSDLLKAPAEQAKRERKSAGGVQYRASNRTFVQRNSEL